ncbi:MAG: hypothetical protein K5707_05875 [Clostridia bacterium]|nr:hypothetical protein [Clostridia bacterium]
MLLFITSTLFSFTLSESGATVVIATKIMKLVDRAKTDVTKAFAAVMALGIIQAILVIGGINAIVYVFMLTGIARDLFKKTEYPVAPCLPEHLGWRQHRLLLHSGHCAPHFRLLYGPDCSLHLGYC